MSALSRARASGRYLLGTPWLTAELETIDGNLEKTINGDLGGVWNPTARLVVGGAGMRVGKDADLQDVRELILTSDAVVSFQQPGKPLDRLIDMSDGRSRPFPLPTDDPGWKLKGAVGTRPTWIHERADAFGSTVMFDLRLGELPKAVVITGARGTFAALPAARSRGPTKPRTIEIVRYKRVRAGQVSFAVPTLESLAIAADEWVDAATYEAPHDVTVTPDEDIEVDPTWRYSIRVTAENGVHDQPADEDNDAWIGGMFVALRVSVRLLKLDPHRT